MQPWEVIAKKQNWSRDQSKLLFLDDCFRANGVHGHFIASDTLETIYLLPPPNVYVAQKAGKPKSRYTSEVTQSIVSD